MSFLLDPAALSSEQAAIVGDMAQSQRVYATAGSGKTTLLAHAALARRMAGVPVEQIKLLTFTRTATEHLRQYLAAMASQHRIDLPEPRTILSYAGQLLQRLTRAGYGLAGSRALGINDPQLREALSGAIHQGALALRDHDDEFDIPQDNPANLATLHALFTRIKGERRFDLRTLLDSDDAIELDVLAEQARQPVAVMAFLVAFERIRERKSFMTFADVLTQPLDLLAQFSDAYQVVKEAEWVLLDEANDLNSAQLQVALAGRLRSAKVIAVGDENQCVLTSLGAHPEVMAREFPARVPGAVDVTLAGARRFGGGLAKRIQRTVRQQSAAASQCHSVAAHVTKVQAVSCDIPSRTVALLAEHLAADATGTAAVLSRERHLLVDIEVALVESKIAYELDLGQPFFFDPTVTALLGLLAAGGNRLAKLGKVVVAPAFRADMIVELAGLLFPEYPIEERERARADLLAITDGSGSFLRYAVEQAHRLSGQLATRDQRLARFNTHWDYLVAIEADAPAAEVLAELGQRFALREQLHGQILDPIERRAVLGMFERLQTLASRRALSVNALLVEINRLRTAYRAIGRPGVKGWAPRVSLSTFLKAKGREFDLVILTHLDADISPQPFPRQDTLNDPGEHAIAERRLFYVAATRARHVLRLLSSEKGQVSPFVLEMLDKAA
ncbi:UvrD-helicase domain-containing protein [Chitinimonas arctica]|nr:ATP-dependent helicase [Chitinimonas arctica]